MQDFEPFMQKVTYLGMFNSLSQTLLKIASPGVPDFFQGTEIWDFSLVDPDNRRPVDYSLRKKILDDLKKQMAEAKSDLPRFHRELLRHWRDGCIKLYVIHRALNFRKEHPSLFLNGSYIPLAGDGDLKENICAFARLGQGKVVLTIVPRFLTRPTKTHEIPLGTEVWRDSSVVIPSEIVEQRFRNIFTGEKVDASERGGKNRLILGQIFANFPVAMLEGI